MTNTTTATLGGAVAASAQAEALARRLELGIDALITFASTLTERQWQTLVPKDGRTVGVVVHHVASVFPIEIATSVPVEPWRPDTVTLLGDAIHTMTPGRGVGANTALRDALQLCRKLVDVRDGRAELLAAVRGYEATMIG